MSCAAASSHWSPSSKPGSEAPIPRASMYAKPRSPVFSVSIESTIIRRTIAGVGPSSRQTSMKSSRRASRMLAYEW